MSKQQELRAYPILERHAGDNEGNLETTQQRGALCIVLLQDNQDPLKTVFAIGESVCHSVDNFWKTRGIGIARGRALKAGDCDYSDIFTLDEALQLNEDGKSIVKTPMTGLPFPVGMVKRLGDLMEEPIPEDIYTTWKNKVEDIHATMVLDEAELEQNQHMQGL